MDRIGSLSAVAVVLVVLAYGPTRCSSSATSTPVPGMWPGKPALGVKGQGFLALDLFPEKGKSFLLGWPSSPTRSSLDEGASLCPLFAAVPGSWPRRNSAKGFAERPPGVSGGRGRWKYGQSEHYFTRPSPGLLSRSTCALGLMAPWLHAPDQTLPSPCREGRVAPPCLLSLLPTHPTSPPATLPGPASSLPWHPWTPFPFMVLPEPFLLWASLGTAREAPPLGLPAGPRELPHGRAASEMVYPLLPLFLSAWGGGGVIGLVEGVAEATASLFKVVGEALRPPGAEAPLPAPTWPPPSSAPSSPWPQFLPCTSSSTASLDRTGKGLRTAPRDALIAESVPREALGRPTASTGAWTPWGPPWGPRGLPSSCPRWGCGVFWALRRCPPSWPFSSSSG